VKTRIVEVDVFIGSYLRFLISDSILVLLHVTNKYKNLNTKLQLN